MSSAGIKQVRYFAYPFGQATDFNFSNVLELKRRGIVKAFTTLPSAVPNWSGEVFNLPRLSVGKWSKYKRSIVLALVQLGSHLPRTWYFIFHFSKLLRGKRFNGSLLQKSWQR